MTNFGLSTVRMTASTADRILTDAAPVTAQQITERHLDVLQLQALRIEDRATLGAASDDLRKGRLATLDVARMVQLWNELASGGGQR